MFSIETRPAQCKAFPRLPATGTARLPAEDGIISVADLAAFLGPGDKAVKTVRVLRGTAYSATAHFCTLYAMQDIETQLSARLAPLTFEGAVAASGGALKIFQPPSLQVSRRFSQTWPSDRKTSCSRCALVDGLSIALGAGALVVPSYSPISFRFAY